MKKKFIFSLGLVALLGGLLKLKGKPKREPAEE